MGYEVRFDNFGEVAGKRPLRVQSKLPLNYPHPTRTMSPYMIFCNDYNNDHAHANAIKLNIFGNFKKANQWR